MLIAYIANDEHYEDCVLCNSRGEVELKDNKDILNAVQEWVDDFIGYELNDYNNGDIITTMNVVDTENNKIEKIKIRAIKTTSFELV